MPDPSDSPAPGPKAPGEETSGQAPETKTAEPLSLVPRARSGGAKTPDSPAPATPATGAASFGDFMHWMKTFAATMEGAPAPPPETTKPGSKLPRSTLPKEQRKFQRFDREPGTAEKTGDIAAGAVAEDSATEERSEVEESRAKPMGDDEKSSAGTGRPVPIIPLTGRSSGRRTKAPAERRPYFWLALQLGAFALLVASFLMGRASVAKKAPPTRDAAPAAPAVAPEGERLNVVSPDIYKMIDEAMAAEQDRQFTKAADLLIKVQQINPQLHDIDFHLALLALEGNDAIRALPLLNLAIAQGEQPAAAYKLRGTILNRRGVGRGMNDFENATKVDPFSADNFFFWGEALRRAGKPQAALVRLQQAIDRLREPALEAEYRLKIRLTQIDLGQEQVFADEMAKQLAENPPSPEWLLTAAAVELHRNNYTAAANYLEKASTLMDRDLFTMRLRDYFFFAYQDKKPLERFFVLATGKAPGPTPVPTAAPLPTATGKTAPSPSDFSPTSPLLQAKPSSTSDPLAPDNP